MICSFKDDRARWRGDLKDPVLVVIKEVNHISNANIVSSPNTCCQRSRKKTKKAKGDPQWSLSEEAAKLAKGSSLGTTELKF